MAQLRGTPAVAVKEDRAAVHDLAAVPPVDLASQVVDQEIAVDPVGKRDQRRDHLHAGSHSVDQVRALIQPDIRFKDVVGHHSKPVVPDARPDVVQSTRAPAALISLAASGLLPIPTSTARRYRAAIYSPDTPFNTFIVTHYPEIR